jgi:hypothetical protein
MPTKSEYKHPISDERYQLVKMYQIRVRTICVYDETAHIRITPVDH